MRTIAVLLMAGGLLCVDAVNGRAVGGEGPPAMETVWRAIRGRPNPRLFDGFEAIEDFPLVPAAQGVPPRAAALAAVLCFELGAQSLSDPQLAAATERLIRKGIHSEHVGGKRIVPVDEAVERAVEAYVRSRLDPAARRTREACTVAGQHGRDGQTDEGRAAFVVASYFGQGSLTEGLKVFTGEMILLADVHEEKEASWETVQEAVHKKIPVLLTGPDRALVAVGYYTAGDARWVIACDATQATLQEADPGRPAPVPAPAAGGGAGGDGKATLPTVRKLSLQAATAPPGLVLLSLSDGREKFSASCIYNVRPDVDKLMPDVKRIVVELLGGRPKHWDK
jgi:hypothetical protein